MKKHYRSKCITTSSKATPSKVVLASFPDINPASLRWKIATVNRSNIGAISIGRISKIYDMPQVRGHDDVQIVAVCDVESKRANDADANAMLSRPQREMYTVNF